MKTAVSLIRLAFRNPNSYREYREVVFGIVLDTPFLWSGARIDKTSK